MPSPDSAPVQPSGSSTGNPSRDTAGVLAPPPVFLAIVLLGAELLRWQWPIPLVAAPARWRVLLAVACALTALVVAGAAVLTLRRARTPVEPWKPTRSIVTTGPYRWSRNPIYVAFLWVQAAHAFARGDAWSLLLLPVTVGLLYVAVIRREERYLAQRFGEEYAQYRERTRRWV